MKNLLSIVCVILAVILIGGIACTPTEDTPQDQPNGQSAMDQPDNGGDTPADDPVVDEETPAGEDGGYDMDAEVLFTGEELPEDWPEIVYIRPDMMVVEYLNDDTGLHAFGHAELPIPRFSNWVTNTYTMGNSEWEQDPDNETVDTGEEQVFYVVTEGWALAIELHEIGDNMCAFDYTLMPM